MTERPRGDRYVVGSPTNGRTARSVGVRQFVVAAVVAVLVVSGSVTSGAGPTVARVTTAKQGHRPAGVVAVVAVSGRLAGLVIALDPGHQLGNSNPAFFPYLRVKRWNGRIWKICNTTGTATVRGFPEATFNWDLAVLLRAKLRALGAVVPMTRTSNSWHRWGPCTWDRGRFGSKVHARLMIQIHADGAPAAGHGFHIITPGLTRGWTDHIWRADLALARAMRRGMMAAGDRQSTYISGAISVRTDQTAMNISQIPTVTVENGNMRNPHDAVLMTTARGREFYARALLAGILTYLHR